jgi:hypothetical protein
MMLMGWIMFIGGLTTMLFREELARRFVGDAAAHSAKPAKQRAEFLFIIGLISAFGGLVVITLNLRS